MKFLYIIFFCLFCVACLKGLRLGVSDFSEFSSLPKWDEQDHVINTAEFFYVRLKDATTSNRENPVFDYLLYEHDGGIGTDCKIPKELESTNDIFCMVDVMELDLHFHNMIFEFNVPENMCAYLSYIPHWHYNRRTGKGLGAVYKDSFTCSSDDIETTETVYCESAITVAQYCGNKELCKGDIDDLCEFDCCYGEYDLKEGENSSEGEWGKFTQCIGGLGRTDWSAYDDAGFPIYLTEKADGGITTTYEITSVYEKLSGRPNNFVTANYYDGILENERKPNFYRAADSTRNGNSFLSVECLDKAWETKHRINVVIREWNTKAEFLKFKESNGSRGDPDVAGKEGIECAYYEQPEDSLISDVCGDIRDADDINTESGYPEIKYPDDDDE